MDIQRRSRRAAAAAAAVVVMAIASAGCSSDSSGSSDDDTSSSTGSPASSGGIARAQAEVDKFAANPPLEVSPLPKRPDESTYAINLNCTIPACAPGAMIPAMDALGWQFEEMAFDITKGPAGLQQALTQAIAEKPDVIFMPGSFALTTYQDQVDAAVEQGIKFVTIGASEELPPGYGACIQCAESAEALGALAANIALTDAGGSADMAVAYDKTIAALVSEADGVKQAADENGEGSEVLDLEQSIYATPADNAAKTVSFLQRNPNVKYLVLTSPQFQAATALKSAGLGSQVKIVGMYPLSEADVASVKDGQVVSYAVGELGSLYWRAVDAAARLTLDVEVDPIAPIQSMRVMDESNADVGLLDPADYQDIYLTAWQVK